MALTVVDDFTTIDSTDTTNLAINVGNINAPVLDGQIKVQGTNSWRSRVNNPGVSGVGSDTGTANVDVTNDHIFMWARSLDFTTVNDGGWRIRIATGAGAANFGDFGVGNVDTARVTVSGFFNFCADPLKPFFATGGTPPALTAVRTFVLISDLATASSRDTWFMDEIKRGTGITVTGGAAKPRGSPEIASDDNTNGRGTFIDLLGAFYILGRITIGDITATTNSTFDDANKVWIFQDMNDAVSSAFHIVEFVGGTGTNRATFGTSSGTGTAKEGSGGNTFIAGGNIPFHMHAIDANITTELFGCALTGPLALFDDALRDFVDDSASTFTNDTRNANDATAADTAVASALGDAAYFGHNERFSLLKINTGTAVTGTPTVIWEYSNGTTWTALTDVTDGTASFTTIGLQTVSYSIPDDWVKQAVTNGGTRYWIRGRFSVAGAGTGQLTQCFASMSGGVRWEHANAEAIRCVFTNMGTIRLRNGAFLKKCIITNSPEPAKSAALDLGSADPTADTFRDCTIQNCSKGILLKGTSTGTTTYNFRNIKFSGNTNDVRVDFPGAATVVINVLEGGGTPTVDNVNTSTVTINNAVTLTVHIEDNNEANLQGAQVYMQKSTPTAFTSGAANNAGDVDLVVTQTIDSDIPQAGTCIVFDKSLNVTLPYRFASHDGVNTFTFPTAVTGAATPGGTSTALVSTSTNFLTADIEEGDTIQNTTDGSFAVIDRIIDANNITTSPLQGGTTNSWADTNNFSLHKLATTLVSVIDTVDVPLINGQTDVNGDISLSYNFGTNTNIFVRARKNSAEFATRFQPGRATGTIVSTGITVNITLQEDTVAV